MYGRDNVLPGYGQDIYQGNAPVSPDVPGVLAQMPYQTAFLDKLLNRRRDINAAVDVPQAQPAVQQKQSKVFQGQDGTWYYTAPDGGYRPTKVIHNPDTGKAFYWNDEARDFVPAD